MRLRDVQEHIERVSPGGFWLTMSAMLLLAIALGAWFWRKRYLR